MRRLRLPRRKAPRPNPMIQSRNLKKRADEMIQEATALKHLSDALGPLYASLDENQKTSFPHARTAHAQLSSRRRTKRRRTERQPGYGGQPEEMGQNGPGGYGEPMNNGMPPQQGNYAYGGPMGRQQGGYGGPMQQGGYGGPMMGLRSRAVMADR